MSEWIEVSLGELGEIFDGPHATPTRRDAGPYFLNIASLKDGRLDLSESDHVSPEDFDRWTRRVTPQEGDLLFAYETRLGEAALMPAGIKACLGRRMALIRPRREMIDPRFFLYLYLSPQMKRTISMHAVHGATVDRIPLKTMSSWTLRVPPMKTQRAIAEVLGVLDDKIAANIRTTAQVDEFLAALFERHVRGGAAEVALGDVAGVNMETVRPGEGFLRYIDISAVGQGVYEFPELSDWSDAPSRARRKVRTGDTLWSTVRPNRRAHALILSSDSRLVASTGLAVLTPLSVGSAYLYEATRRLAFARYLESVAEGSAYPAVRAERFLEAPIPMFDKAAREEFEGLASGLRKRAHLATEENRALAATRDALLPGLMSGKLRVRDAERVAEEVA